MLSEYERNLIQCEFCGIKLYSYMGNSEIAEVEKYKHLASHNGFYKKIQDIMKRFGNINKYVNLRKQNIPIRVDRVTHQFFAIIYNHKDIQCTYLLNKLDNLLSLYGGMIELKNPNMISRKILSDIFSFCSELEGFDKLNGLGFDVEFLEGQNYPEVDFVIKKLKISMELKTPIKQTKDLGGFVSDFKIQKQIISRKKRFPEETVTLCVDTRYSYPDFPPIFQGEWIKRGIIKDYNAIHWDCCITFNTFNKKSDLQINPNSNVTDEVKDFLIKLKEKLRFPSLLE